MQLTDEEHYRLVYDGCYAVTVNGDRVEMTPSGLGSALDGVLQVPDPDQ